MTRSTGVASTLGLVVCLLLPGCATTASAQGDSAAVRHAPTFYWSVDVGVTAISAWIQGRRAHTSIPRALVAGLVGGTLVYAGQRVVGSARPTLRLAGLQVAALGANVGRNMGRRVAPLSDLTFPLFPLYVRVRAHEVPRISVRLSTMAIVGGIRMAALYHQAPDVSESLTSGALIFRVPGTQLRCADDDAEACRFPKLGEHFFGTIAYATDPTPCAGRQVAAHEMGHVGQDVRDGVLHGVAASDAALASFGAPGRWLARYVVIDAIAPLMAISTVVGPPEFDKACRNLTSYYECEVEAMQYRERC